MVLLTQNHFFLFSLNSYLSSEHGNEHILEHSLSNKKKFSTPKIYVANGNLKKCWYVYYSYKYQILIYEFIEVFDYNFFLEFTCLELKKKSEKQNQSDGSVYG